LANLARTGLLHPHEASAAEIAQHLSNARDQITDARNASVSLLGQFNSAYGACHALLNAALKMKGYRTSDKRGHRQILFELLDQLVPAAASAKAVLGQAHLLRNQAEYEGRPINATAAVVSSLLKAAENLEEEVRLAFKGFRPAPTA
jgi:hypothetical protein